LDGFSDGRRIGVFLESKIFENNFPASSKPTFHEIPVHSFDAYLGQKTAAGGQHSKKAIVFVHSTESQQQYVCRGRQRTNNRKFWKIPALQLRRLLNFNRTLIFINSTLTVAIKNTK
jgi:hypothetical protein